MSSARRRPDSPLFWPIRELVAAYRERSLSPVEVVDEALERIAALDGALNAFVTATPELAGTQARDAERAYAHGADGGALLGVPVAIKDVFDVSGVRTTLGSLLYRDHVAPDDSGVVRRLRRAGAVFVGKTNTSEFAQSATTENLLGPGTTNPWDPTRTSGGSSGGSAAAVGAGLASLALGADGGGSIRIPAAMCGVFGLKPTLGAVAEGAAFRSMTEFSCAGPLARRVADARPMLEVLLDAPLPLGPSGPLRVGVCRQPEGRPVEPGVLAQVDAAIEALASLGYQVGELDLPVESWFAAFAPLVLVDERRERGQLVPDQAGRLTTYVRRTIEVAASLTAGEIAAAREKQRAIRTAVEVLFETYDLLLTPSTAAVAFPLGNRPRSICGEPVDALWGPFPFTAPFNVAGVPAASVPCGLSGGLPIGVQFAGPHRSEGMLVGACEDLEKALDFPFEEMSTRWSLARV